MIVLEDNAQFLFVLFFFFQAEDGIRDDLVTGVQTCALPISKVYEGALNCVQGWNEFTFDTPFEYPGSGNLLIAIDDNSNNKSIVLGCDFIGNVTANKMALIYYDDVENPNPDNLSTFGGERRAVRLRAQMQLIGCTDGFRVNALSSDTTRGFVDGGGYYSEGSTIILTATAIEPYHFTEWTDGNTDNPRTITVSGDTTFVANFRTEDINNTSINEAVITTKNNYIMISNAGSKSVLVVDILGRVVSSAQSIDNVTITVPKSGVYIVKIGSFKAVKVVIR